MITEGSLSNVRSSRVAVLLDQEAVPKIYELMRQRKNQNGSPELDRFLADLDSVQSIFVGQPLYYSTLAPGRIDTPENLTQAKELLSQAIPVAEVEDGVWALLSLSSDSQDQKMVSREELKHQFLLEGCPVSLFPTKEQDLEAARRYWLVPWEGFCLLVPPDDPVTLVACFPSGLYDQLAELARSEEPERVHPVTGS